MNTWTVSLPPELATFVTEQLAQKKWVNADLLFAAAISGLKHAEATTDTMDNDWLRAQIQAGMDQINRGELLEENEVFDDILKDLREPLQKTA